MAKSYLESPQFQADKYKKTQEALEYKLPGVEQMYWEIESDNTDGIHRDSASSYYEQLFSWRWKWLMRYIEPQDLSKTELVDYQLQLHASLAKQLNDTRDTVLTPGFKPQSIEQLDCMSRLQNRRYRSSLDISSQMPYAAEFAEQLEQAESDLDEARQKGKNPAYIAELEQHAAKARQEMEMVYNLHTGDITPLIVEGITIYKSLVPGDRIPSRVGEITEELTEQRIHMGAAVRDTRLHVEELIDSNIDIVMEALRESTVCADIANRCYSFLSPEAKREHRADLIEALFEGFENDFFSASTESEVDEVYTRMFDALDIVSTRCIPLLDLQADNPSAAHTFLQRATKLALSQAKTSRQALRFFPTEDLSVTNPTYFGVRDPFDAKKPNFHSSTTIFEAILGDEIFEELLKATSRSLEVDFEATDTLEDVSILAGKFQGLETFIQQVEKWNEGGLVTGERFLEPLKELTSDFITKMELNFRQLELHNPKRVVRTLLTVQFPRVLNLAQKKPTSDGEALFQDLGEMAKSGWIREAFAHTFSYAEISNAVSATGYFDEPWSKGGDQERREEFYQLIALCGDLIGDRDPMINTYDEMSRHRQDKDGFCCYLRDNYDDKWELLSRIMHEQYHRNRSREADPEQWEMNFARESAILYYDKAVEAHQEKDGIEKYDAIFAEALPKIRKTGYYKSHLVELAPTNLSEKFQYAAALRKALEREVVITQTDEELRARQRSWADHQVEEILGEVDASSFADVATETMIDYFTTPELGMKASRDRDEIFESIWKRMEDEPELREKLCDPKLIETLYYEENKEQLARYQLEHLLHLEQENRWIRSKQTPPAQRIRQIVYRAKQLLDKQFSKPDLLKDSCIDYVERQIQTTLHESDELAKSRTSYDNWVESPLLTAVELPEIVRSSMKTNYDRVQVVEYLIGTREELPELFDDIKTQSYLSNYEKVVASMESAKRAFDEGNIHLRTYVLMPLLDHAKGILSSSEHMERVMKIMLGDYAEDPVYRELVDAYLGSCEPSDQRVIIAHVLSSFAGKKQQQREGASVRQVLEAMGPFGIKAGQFIRANGLGSPELLAELGEFFDHALPPNWRKQLQDMKRAFGDKVSRIQLRGLKGSGSLNYVTEFEFYPEQFRSGMSPQRAAGRVQRDNVEGQIQNENTIWLAAIEQLREHPTANIRRAASIMNEARRGAMDTLESGGVELDLSVERDSAPLAIEAYETERDEETGYAVRAVLPLKSLQALVADDMQTSFSTYELINGVSITGISEEALQAPLARQIIGAELKAHCDRGKFDPDAHPGNWLIDEENQELIRLDYAQILAPPHKEMRDQRQVLRESVLPNLGNRWKNVISQHSDKIFELSDSRDNGLSSEELHEVVRKALKTVPFPEESDLGERVFYLREHVENELNKIFGTDTIQVLLRPTMRATLGHLSRIQSFKQFLCTDEGEANEMFVDIVSEHLFANRLTALTYLARGTLSAYITNWLGGQK